MFWVCFFYSGPLSLYPVERMMNSKKKKDILQCKIIPELAKIDGAVFQHDLAQFHIYKAVKKFLETDGIVMLDCPGNSSYINAIANLWVIVKTQLATEDCMAKEK